MKGGIPKSRRFDVNNTWFFMIGDQLAYVSYFEGLLHFALFALYQ